MSLQAGTFTLPSIMGAYEINLHALCGLVATVTSRFTDNKTCHTHILYTSVSDAAEDFSALNADLHNIDKLD